MGKINSTYDSNDTNNHTDFYKMQSDDSGSGSIVGIATGYGLDGPGFESRWG